MKLWNRYDRRCPVGAISIMRDGLFGNPFVIGKHGTRAEVCGKYGVWIHQPEQAELRAKMRKELSGKDIMCCCLPRQCHGETIIEICK